MALDIRQSIAYARTITTEAAMTLFEKFAQASLAGKFNDTTAATKFIKAGRATLTLKSNKTGDHLTYRVEANNKRSGYYVSVLDGPNNESDYKYIGYINKFGEFRLTPKSRVAETAVSYRAFWWAWGNLTRGTMPSDLEVWHAGCCGRCGRTLTRPDSVASGFGPECITKI